jgi:methyl-accepting chemotaxis protein
MDQVTQQNAANSEQSASAAEELSAQAQELSELVGRFKLDHQARGVARPIARAQRMPPALVHAAPRAKDGAARGKPALAAKSAPIPVHNDDGDAAFREF